MAENGKFYSVLYLTPELFREYHNLAGTGRQIDGMPLDWMLEAFCVFVSDFLTGHDDRQTACVKCEKGVVAMQDIGCVAGLFDPAIMQAEDDAVSVTIWGVLCGDCHDENPETAQARLLKQISDHTGGGEVINMPSHATVQ
jgi:hypothetical protein